MSDATEFEATRELNAVGAAPGLEGGSERATAVLFYQLAKLLVWAQQHAETVEEHADFRALVREAAATLANNGVRVATAEGGRHQHGAL
ncbi:MAG TPA: hypothetical protein VG675_03570 [Bryobacteraceae bacterium]|nr:hypothetical protein [Bryobacteraceae bacterium]